MASPLESAITLEDVFAMVTGKRVPLAPELAGYLSLEIAEKADAAGSTGRVDSATVYIADEGTVALVRARGASGDGDAEQSIRDILAQLLDASGSSTPALLGVSRRAPTRGEGSLRGLMEEIEAALIPVNRAAGRRALARLAREVKRVTHGVGRNAPSARSPSGEPLSRRPRESGPDAPDSRGPARPPPSVRGPVPKPAPPPIPEATVQERPTTPAPAPVSTAATAPPPPRALFDNPSDVDSLLEQFSRSTSQSEKAVSQDLKDLVDIGQTDAPPVVELKAWPPPNLAPFTGSAPPPAPDVDDLLAMADEPPPPSLPPPLRPEPPPSPAPAPPPRLPAPRPPAARAAPAAPAPRPLSSREMPTRQSVSVAEWAKPKKKRTDYWIIIAILALLAASSATVWFFKPGLLSGRTAEKVAEEKAANEALRQKQLLAQQEKMCKAAIDVTDVPTGAEVLLRVGQAPVDVPHLPVGARLEFVATAEGYAPKRAVIPSGATWDTGPEGKPRFEVGVQLDKSNPKLKLGDPWPPGDPGSEVGGKGAPGTVHLVSTPKGAEVWMLAGLGPEALIEQLPCDQSVDVLVAGPTTFRKRLHAAPSDFSARPGEAGSKIAKLSAH